MSRVEQHKKHSAWFSDHAIMTELCFSSKLDECAIWHDGCHCKEAGEMKDEQIKAIEAAIKKWSLVAYGSIQSHGSKNCPLCALYYNDDCDSCPIGKTNYKCEGTPCRSVKNYTYLRDEPDMADAVEQEIIFLCSLLPKEHEWYEKFNGAEK